jgi:hypothetical protein
VTRDPAYITLTVPVPWITDAPDAADVVELAGEAAGVLAGVVAAALGDAAAEVVVGAEVGATVAGLVAAADGDAAEVGAAGAVVEAGDEEAPGALAWQATRLLAPSIRQTEAKPRRVIVRVEGEKGRSNAPPNCWGKLRKRSLGCRR